MEKKLCADVFIVPNPGTKFGKLFSLSKERMNYWCDQLGIEHPTDDTTMVQVWVTGSGSQNWADHGTPWAKEKMEFDEAETDKDKNEFYFTSWLPISLFEGKKEGDFFMLEGPEKSLVLELHQKGYRYEKFGPFEKVLEDVTKEVAA